MGESWGDLDAAEYLCEHGHSNAGQPFGRRPLRHRQQGGGIRDYAMSKNPLNYSDYGFDPTGPEVHADGEIWNGPMYDLRQALVASTARLPLHPQGAARRSRRGPQGRRPPSARATAAGSSSSSTASCSNGASRCSTRATRCSPRIRCGSAARTRTCCGTLARRGMGGAPTPDADSDPTPGFASPIDAGQVKFTATGPSGAPPGGKVYVGDYEARATPVADTDRPPRRGPTRPS